MAVDLKALGGFFSAETHAPASPPAAPWRSMAELINDPAVLAERFEQVRRTLAAKRPLSTVPPRAAASVCQLGLATRLLSPALASAAAGEPIDLSWTALHWQPGVGGAFPLSVQHGPATSFADAIGLLMGELEAAMNEFSPISPVIFWGNLGSALNGAASMYARLRPELAGPGYALARSAIEGFPHPAAAPGFRRRSCCLLYQASPYGRAAICPDCVLGPG